MINNFDHDVHKKMKKMNFEFFFPSATVIKEGWKIGNFQTLFKILTRRLFKSEVWVAIGDFSSVSALTFTLK